MSERDKTRKGHVLLAIIPALIHLRSPPRDGGDPDSPLPGFSVCNTAAGCLSMT